MILLLFAVLSCHSRLFAVYLTEAMLISACHARTSEFRGCFLTLCFDGGVVDVFLFRFGVFNIFGWAGLDWESVTDFKV